MTMGEWTTRVVEWRRLFGKVERPDRVITGDHHQITDEGYPDSGFFQEFNLDDLREIVRLCDEYKLEVCISTSLLRTEGFRGEIKGHSLSVIVGTWDREADYLPESPLEVAFWQRWQELHPNLTLKPQCPVNGTPYRLDFAHWPSKTAIELDGFTYHRDPDRFQHDRQRDRELTQAGWRVIRFASTELRNDLDGCIHEVTKIIGVHSR